MSDLYDTDILLWSERQAQLLRRRVAGELVNDNDLDWPNIAEEIEDVGRSQLHSVESLLVQALRHMLKAKLGRSPSMHQAGGPMRSISVGKHAGALCHRCGRGSMWRASMPTRSRPCPRRSTANRRCRCHGPAR